MARGRNGPAGLLRSFMLCGGSVIGAADGLKSVCHRVARPSRRRAVSAADLACDHHADQDYRAQHGPKWGRGVGFCASARVGPAAIANRSERPVHSAKQPADPKRYYRHSIGLGLDSSAKPFVKSDSGVASGVCCLAVQVLGGPRRLIELSPKLGTGVPCQAAYTLFNLAADISRCAGYAVFIHGSGPSRHGRRSYSAPLFVSHAT